MVEYQLPLGGTISLQGSSELRYPWAHGITWAVFTDAGVLLDSFTELGLDALRYSAGAGVRYETPVGPVRFDVSVRPLFPEDTDPATCRGTEVEPHAYDLFSSFERWKDPDSHPPFALVFFLAIGEAI